MTPSRSVVSLGRSCCQNLARWAAPCRHARCLQIVRWPLASWIAPPTVWRIRRLQLSRERQRRAQPLVLDDRARRHRLDLVEHPERQGDTFVPDSKAPVRVIHHLDLLAREAAREGRRIQQKHHPVVAQCEIAGERPLLAPSQDLVEIVGLGQRAMQIFCVRRRPAETLVVVFDKPGQPGIGRLDRRNAGQTQFLDQPVLQRALQDRLVKELRLAGISTVEAANAWLPGFVEDYNKRFGRAPANAKNLHRPLTEADDLDEILAWREERTLTRNLTLRYDRMMLLLDPTPFARARGQEG